ncbi:hypothetical protein WDW89_15720 [Deltaproteobacteria bacterium TL4]
MEGNGKDSLSRDAIKKKIDYKETLSPENFVIFARLRDWRKENIQLNRTCRGAPFLGFRVFPCHVRLLPRSMRRFSTKYREYERNYCEGLWSESEIIRHLEPLVAFTNLGDSTPFRRMAIEKFGVLF